MNERQKNITIALRTQGLSYSKIASRLGVSIDSIKSCCRTNRKKLQEAIPQVDTDCCYCPACGKELIQPKVGRRRRFCSDSCRARYWSAYSSDNSRYKATCANCGKEFSSTHRKRRFCSTGCYFDHRFHGGNDETL